MDNLEGMDKFLEKCDLPLLNQEEIENMNRSIPSMEAGTNQKYFYKQKPRTRWLHRWILPKVWVRAETYPCQTFPENCRGRKTPKLILWGNHHPQVKTKDATKNELKVQANITD